MAGEDVRIGPFNGGLNTLSDASSIEDTELVELINFECDIDGSLVSRPPIVSTGVNMPLDTTGNMKVLGYYVTPTGAPYLIGSDGKSKTYYFDGTTWTLITNTFAAAAMCQFKDKAWLVAPVGSTNPGGTWSLAGGFAVDNNMPRGACIVANKERLWLGQGKNATANGARLYLTDIVSGQPQWNGNFIDIGPGDGQNIVDLVVYFSDLIVFKQGSTYRFSYATDPSVGTISRVSDNVGAADTNCWASYENQLYVMFDNKVYLFSNYNYERLNFKLPLKANNPSVSLSEYTTISCWSDRIFVAYYDRMFVYNLRTRTWSEWKSTTLVNIGRIIPPPPNVPTNSSPAYTYSTLPRTNTLYKINEALPAVTGEAMVCSFQTKNFDYQVAQRFKRLFWWGIDVLSRSSLTSYALPITYANGVTWDQLAAYNWDQIAGNTWDRPLDISLVVADTVSTEGLTGGRKFIKHFKSLRFRQIAYRVEANTTGTQSDAPVRVFNLTTMVKDKQRVSAKIS